MFDNFVSCRFPSVEDVWSDAGSSFVCCGEKFSDLEDAPDSSASVSKHHNIQVHSKEKILGDFNGRIHKALDGFCNAIRVHSCIYTMSSVHGFEENFCLVFLSHFSENNPIWTHTEAVDEEVKHGDFSLSFRVWLANGEGAPVKEFGKL